MNNIDDMIKYLDLQRISFFVLTMNQIFLNLCSMDKKQKKKLPLSFS